MLPSEHFDYFFFGLLQRMGYVIGCEYMQPTFKRSWRTSMFILGIGTGNFALAYTMLTKDRMLAMQSSTTLAVTLQGTVKYIVFLTNTRSLSEHVAYLQRVYRQCDAFWPESLRLIHWATICKRGIVIIGCILCLAAACFCALPLYQFTTAGEMVLLLPILMPGLDETTPSGYIGQTVCQIIFVLMMLVGMTGSDSSIGLLIVQMCALSEIIILKIHILDDVVRHNDQEIRTKAEQRRQRVYLHNIVRMHVEFVKYVREISDLFYVVFMVEVLFDGLGMCLIMFVHMQAAWFPLYMFWIVYFVKILLVCGLGTMTEYYFDKLHHAFEKFPWYKMPLIDQRCFLMILQRVQNPTVLLCGTVPLNMELFVTVMKNTYSLAMLLMNFEGSS